MQFQVPQFLEVEVRIFGPLTIKQFIYLAGGAGITFVIYSITKNLFYTFIFAAPVLVFASVLALKKVNNKPFSYIMEAAIKYFFSKKLYLWKKVNRPIENPIDLENMPHAQNTSAVIPTLGDSKLKEMAWRLNISREPTDSPISEGKKSLIDEKMITAAKRAKT